MCDCTCSVKIHIGPKLEAKIARGVKRAVAHLKPNIVWVNWRIGEDWTGDTSIFYNIVLQEYIPDASFRIVRDAVDKLNNFADIPEIGIHSYYNIRTVKEMEDIEAKLKKNPTGQFSSDYEQWKRP